MYYIYILRNVVNQKIYIGQTKNMKNRWASHISEMKRNKVQTPIYKALRKYGPDNFTYEVIVCSKTQEGINEAEISIIIQYDSRNMSVGYNLAPGGYISNYWLGKQRSEETKIKMSQAMMGKKYPNRQSPPEFSEEHRKNLSIANTGRTHSLKVKKILSDKAKLQIGIKNGKYCAEISDERILELFDSGLSSRKIAKAVGMKSHTGILYRLHKMGK